MMELWNNMDPGTQKALMFFVGFMVLYAIGMFVYMQRKKGDASRWLAQNPNAAKVFLATKSNVIRNNYLVINSVDGQAPVEFFEGIKKGFYLLPGSHIVESSFSTSRPGILYRRVTTSYGPTKQELTVEANKTYTYTFDLKNESYEFIEM